MDFSVWDCLDNMAHAAMGALGQQNAKDYATRAEKELAAKDFGGAETDYSKAIELDPKSGTLFYNRGFARQKKGDLDAAAKDYTRAIELGPKVITTYAYVARATVKYTKDNFDGAIQDYTQAIKIESKDAKIYVGRGGTRRENGDLDGALRDFNQAIALDSSNAEAFHGLSTVERSKGDLKAALADCDKAIELNPKNADFYYDRGIVRYGTSDFKGAIKDWERDLSHQEPGSSEADYHHFLIWIAQTKTGDTSAAKEKLSSYLTKRTIGGPEDWPANITRFLLGQIGENAFSTAAASPDSKTAKGRQCEFWYYAGIKQLLNDNKEKAAEDFKKCIATEQHMFTEYVLAKLELKAVSQK